MLINAVTPRHPFFFTVNICPEKKLDSLETKNFPKSRQTNYFYFQQETK
jgi:hypothetical protein